MTYQFSFGFIVTSSIDGRLYTDANLENIVDELMVTMLETETEIVFDSAVGAILSQGEVDIDVAVNAEDEVAAGAVARDFVIESIRNIGGEPIGIWVFPPDHGGSAGNQEQTWRNKRHELTQI